jgi:uncharacterized protein (DUF302 family)
VVEISNRRHFVKQIAILGGSYCLLPYKHIAMENPDGVITRQSPYSVEETTNRFVFFLQQHGVKLYARIDQQAELQTYGLHTLPMEFILFGNPGKGGAVILQNPVAALDLPLKIVVWEDTSGKTQFAYNDIQYFGNKYSLDKTLTAPLNLDVMVSSALK